MSLQELEPKNLWKYFEQLNEVPRPSKKEERVIQFMKSFGENLGLETTVDHIGNVIIKKPANGGMESRKTVVMQGHLDMVHQKNSGTDFDFDSEGIKMLINDDWVEAEGTTLGADNGIGVAAIMAVLADQNIAHPPIEALFTIDEETGMTGAKELKGDVLTGDIMLNLDTEDDRELCIGCAGGIDITARGNYSSEPIKDGYEVYSLNLSGLAGGHSGMDIHLGRGNANKLMNRALYSIWQKTDAQLIAINGGGLRNAIPRESKVTIALPSAFNILQHVNNQKEEFLSEHRVTDPELNFECQKIDASSYQAVESVFALNFIRTVYAIHVGIYRMSPDMEDLVQTSNNLARIELNDGQYEIQCLTRSSVDSEKMDLAHSLKATFELIGSEVEFSGTYPGWTPKPEADIVSLMSNLYREKFNSEPEVNACHAGLECGILGQNYPEMQMISFGPNIRGAHSPDEKVQISSVQKFWSLLEDTLKNIPE